MTDREKICHNHYPGLSVCLMTVVGFFHECDLELISGYPPYSTLQFSDGVPVSVMIVFWSMVLS